MIVSMQDQKHMHEKELKRSYSVAHKQLNCPCFEPGSLVNLPVNTNRPGQTAKEKWKNTPLAENTPNLFYNRGFF